MACYFSSSFAHWIHIYVHIFRFFKSKFIFCPFSFTFFPPSVRYLHVTVIWIKQQQLLTRKKKLEKYFSFNKMHIKSRLYTWNVYFCTDIKKLYALATPPIHLKWITSSVIVCSELAWNIIHMQHQLKCHFVAYCMHFSASNECKMIFQKKTAKTSNWHQNVPKFQKKLHRIH